MSTIIEEIALFSNPRMLLALEGAAVLAFASWSYAATGAGWRLFALLFLAPDLLMLGYLANPKLGSACYNLAHTEVLPILLLIFTGPAVATICMDLAGTRRL